MPPLETDCREQDAVLWAANGYDLYGVQQIDAGVDIKVRWEDRNGETKDAAGNTVFFDAVLVVDRVISIESIVWQGTVATLPDPAAIPDLHRVEFFTDVPDIKGREHRRVAFLARFNDTLPTIAS